MQRALCIRISGFEPGQKTVNTKMRSSSCHDFFVFPDAEGFAGFSDLSDDAAGFSVAPLPVVSADFVPSLFPSLAPTDVSGFDLRA